MTDPLFMERDSMKGISDSVAICMGFQDTLPAVSLGSIPELPIGSTARRGNAGREDSPTDNGAV